MPVEIRVPPLGESVVEATVGRWTKKEGDSVAKDEILVELETDKVTVEVAAQQAGTLGKIAKSEGDTVGVNELLGTLEAADGATPADAGGADGLREVRGEAARRSSRPPRPAAAPAAAPEAAGGVRGRADVAGGALAGGGAQPGHRHHPRHGAQRARDQGRRAQGDRGRPRPRCRARPGARAARGPGRRPPRPRPRPSRPAPKAPAAPAQPGREERQRMSRRRQTIARRLVEAQQTTASLTTFNEVDLKAVMDLRKTRQDEFVKKNGIKLGFMSFFTKAVIGALKQFPRLNAEIQGDEIVLKHHYDIGIAVGAEEGLVVPVVRDADRLSFAGLEKAIADLGTRAKENKLSLEELQGGTFTITNGGTFGSMLSTPILNPPQVGILGMHNIVERPVVVNGEIVIRPIMYVALTYDHRIVDGSEAVRFLVTVKRMLEDPMQMLLEG